MSLKLPDKGQWVFIGLVMCLVTYYAGSVSVYFLNGKTPLYIWKNFDSMLLWKIITESNIRTDIRLTAIPSLLSGMVSSLIVPVFVIWQLNKMDVALYGDAKFASDNDLKNQNCLSGRQKMIRIFWSARIKENICGIPPRILYLLVQEPAPVKVPPLVSLIFWSENTL